MSTFVAPELTIFIPLSGRESSWLPLTEFLEAQQIDEKSVLLCFLDTSHSPEFQQRARKWLAGSRYRNVRYIQKQVGRSGLADIRRVNADRSSDRDLHREIQIAMCDIYATLRKIAHTPFVWIIEDDIIPPLDAYAMLRSAMCPRTVSVSGVYEHRYKVGKVVAWDRKFELLDEGTGVQEIGGNGFGCLLIRSSTLTRHVFLPDTRWPDFDRAFYLRLDRDELVKLHWSVRCKHLSPSFEYEPCPHPYESYISRENFSEEFYLAEHPDVRELIDSGMYKDGYDHYERLGRQEGRAAVPRMSFDEEYYLTLYPDVRAAVEKGTYHSGLQHYLTAGRKEGRYSRPQLDAKDDRVGEGASA